MKKTLFLLIFLILFFMPVVSAKDIIMSVDQKDYYFLTGQDAIIPLTYDNSYGKQINGQLKYTITQEINQGGFYYSSTNSHSSSFNANEGEHSVNLNFGTSDTPALYKVSMTLNYEYDQDERAVTLDQIDIYFVSNQSQVNNQPNKQESSSQKVANIPQNQQPPQQNSQQQLQNNQKSQDVNALKQQLEKQLQEKEQTREEFQNNLFNNSDFQKLHQELQNQGYNLTNSNINPTDNNSGSFSMEYQNEKGEKATLEGEMNNGELENVEKLTSEDKQQMLDQLFENEEFKQYQNQLQSKGFNQTNIEFTQNGNKTNIRLNYQDEKNQTATINAEFSDGVLQDVELEKEELQQTFPWTTIIIIIIAIVSCIILYIIYKRYYKKSSESHIALESKKKEPFNYITEANKLLNEAKKLFEKKKYKDAYSKSGQSLRLFLSYYYGLKKELTNDEIIRFLKNKKTSYQEIKECLDLCNLVEFAKYEANKKDFDKITQIIKKTIIKLHS